MSRFGVLLLGLGWAGVAGCSVVLDFDEVPLPAYEVHGGGAFTCASREPQGALWCWGSNQEHPLAADHETEPLPTLVARPA